MAGRHFGCKFSPIQSLPTALDGLMAMGIPPFDPGSSHNAAIIPFFLWGLNRRPYNGENETPQPESNGRPLLVLAVQHGAIYYTQTAPDELARKGKGCNGEIGIALAPPVSRQRVRKELTGETSSVVWKTLEESNLMNAGAERVAWSRGCFAASELCRKTGTLLRGVLNRGNGRGRNKGGTSRNLGALLPRVLKATLLGLYAASSATSGRRANPRSKRAGADAQIVTNPDEPATVVLTLSCPAQAQTRYIESHEDSEECWRFHPFSGNQTFEEEVATLIIGLRCCFTESLALPLPGLPILLRTG
ncbi:hypothetical protein DFH06DRAFT_1139431 [Mycena polygramma]|nr:hypothetical protein DFH06DRAFT_1139431 [Mycena polygramma]